MKIAILGNGGREHAIATKISKSPKLEKLYCIPGNAGTDSIAENVELDFYNFESLLRFIKKNKDTERPPNDHSKPNFNS